MPPQPLPPAATTDYGTAYGELDSSYDPQVAQVNAALATLPGQQAAAQSSLDQAKANAFKDYSLTSNSRGLLYSGYQPYQQNSYTTNTYDPAVKNLNDKVTTQTQSLKDKITDINNKRAVAAENLVLSTQNDQAKASVGSSGGSGSSASSKPLTQRDTTSAIRQGLESVKGSDGHVSPGNLAKAYQIWTEQGLNPNSFWTNFQGYWNPNEGDYKQLFNAARA